MSRQRIHLTERGEWVVDCLGALAAIVVIPGSLLVFGKLVGL